MIKVASNWEKFIDSIERIIHSWELDNGNYGISSNDSSDPLFFKKDIINFGDHSFVLSYLSIPSMSHQTELSNAMDVVFKSNSKVRRHQKQNEFITLKHPHIGETFHTLHRMSGHRHILLLNPFTISEIFGNLDSFEPGFLKLILSAFAIALKNMNCFIPVFISLGGTSSNSFRGYQFSFNYQTCELIELDYNMYHFPFLYSEESELSRISKWFYDRLQSIKKGKYRFHCMLVLKNAPYFIGDPVIHSSALFSYTYQLPSFADWLQQEHSISSKSKPVVELNIPFLYVGQSTNPVDSLNLQRHFSKSPIHRINTKFDDSHHSTYYLSVEIQSTYDSRDSSLPVLGSIVQYLISLLNQDIHVHDSSQISTTSPMYMTIQSKLDILFSHNYPSHIPYLYPLNQSHKLVPRTSFLWLLAYHILESLSPKSVVHISNFINFIIHLWSKITEQIREHWLNGKFVPGINIYATNVLEINLKTPLLHQKLEMLNCCIRRKYYANNNSPFKTPSISSLVSSSSPHRKNPEKNSRSLTSISSRFLNTITEIASDVVTPSVQTAPHGSGEGQNILINLFDKLTTATSTTTDTNTTTNTAALFTATNVTQPTETSSPVTIQQPGKSRIANIEGTSWKSDKSWEDFSVSPTQHEVEDKSLFYESMEEFDRHIQKGNDTNPKIKSDESNHSLLDASLIFEEMGSLEYRAVESFVELDSDETSQSFVGPVEGALKLLNGEPMLQPILQEPAVMTEDMLLEQEKMFENLGTSEEAREQRAKMQSAQLISGTFFLLHLNYRKRLTHLCNSYIGYTVVKTWNVLKPQTLVLYLKISSDGIHPVIGSKKPMTVKGS